MIIAVGTDHRGAAILQHLNVILEAEGCEVVEPTLCSTKTCDYPDMAYPVATAVAEGRADRGILVCGSGIGMSITANKVHGIRAALVHDELGAEMSRRHNNANILCLAADLLGQSVIERIVQLWLKTEFEGGRHARRVDKIAAIENGQNPAETCDESLAAE
jgi:ribose 5-phosphate isomerase B